MSCRTINLCHRRNKEALRSGNSLLIKSPELAIEWHPILNGSLKASDVLPSSHKKVWWICNDCGHEWKTAVYTRQAGAGCPICRKSRGEQAVYSYLRVLDIPVETQVSMEGLVGVGGMPLTFDFKINTPREKQLLIEYDGEQHFRPISFGDNPTPVEEQFRRLKEHDRRKNEYCVREKIPLVRIKYSDFHNIPEIIDTALQNHFYEEAG